MKRAQSFLRVGFSLIGLKVGCAAFSGRSVSGFDEGDYERGARRFRRKKRQRLR
jgi:hypothetical protein